MALSVAATLREQSAKRMGQELEPYQQRSGTVEQGALFLGRQVRGALKVERNRLLK